MSQPFPASSLRNAALLYGGMFFVAVVANEWISPPQPSLALPEAAAAWPVGLLAGLLLLLATYAAERFWPQFSSLADTMSGMLGPVTSLQALLLAALSGVGEEALFRGPLQVAVGPILATLLFAALHGLGNRRLWPWPLFALLAGGVFAWLAWRFRSPWPGAVAHAVVNAVNLRRLGQRYERRVAAGNHA